MNRRLKDRIPAAIRARLRRMPQIVVMVTATIVITPEALAQVQTQAAEARFVVQGTKTAEGWLSYTKEELAKTKPTNPVVRIEDRLAAEVSEIFRKMTANQNNPDQANKLNALKTAQPDEQTVKVQLAALKEQPKTGAANAEGIRSLMAGESQKALTQQTKSHVSLFDKLTSGLNFNLDLGSLFGRKKDQPKEQSGQVRYGLVLQDIKPAKNAPKRAAIADNSSEMDFAGHADVKWTIGPLSEEQGRRLFTIEENAPQEEGQGVLSGIKLPQPTFTGKATPENFDNFAKVKDKQNLPAWRFDLLQTDGYYSLMYRTATDGKRIGEEHQFMVPIVGDMKVGRRFNDKWEVIQTSASNILVDKRLPIVSVHHMHLEQRYKADLGYTIKGHTVGVAGRGKAYGPVQAEDQRPERYDVTYSKDF